MNILVISLGMIPGASGAWNGLRLLCDHNVTVITTGGKKGRYTLGGIKVVGVGPLYSNRIKKIATRMLVHSGLAKESQDRDIILFTPHIQQELRKGNYDICWSMGEKEAFITKQLNCRYVIDLRRPPVYLDIFNSAKTQARWIITTTPFLDEGDWVPHSIELSKYNFTEHKEANQAVLLATLNKVELPFKFIKAVAKSKAQGTIIGTGPLKNKVEAMCKRYNVNYLGGVYKDEVPKTLADYQIGVSLLGNIIIKAPFEESRVLYTPQLKTIEYMACGLLSISSPRNSQMIKKYDCGLLYNNIQDLTHKINNAVDNWEQCRKMRLQGRRLVEEYFNVEKWRNKVNKKIDSIINE